MLTINHAKKIISRIWLIVVSLAISTPTNAASLGGIVANAPGGRIAAVFAVLLLLCLMAVLTLRILKLKSMAQSSLFTKLFVVVAVSSAFFSAVSSAIGFGLITSQENADFLRNVILPPAFGLFVFFLTVAIWVGGGELLRHRDWFRYMDGRTGLAGFFGDILHFVERAVKLFVVIPVLGAILFFVSTWTSVVGIGGVDAVRYAYTSELNRLQTECAGIVAYRKKDFFFWMIWISRSVTWSGSHEAKGKPAGKPDCGGVARFLTI